MLKTPREQCLAAASALQSLKGVPIVYGFGKQVRSRLGGVQSCSHLLSLVMAMGAASVQGGAVHRGRGGPGTPEQRRMVVEYLKDNCVAWASDGEVYRAVRKELGVDEE